MPVVLLFLYSDILQIDCQNSDHCDSDVLSWIFKEAFIRNCLEQSLETSDRRVKTSLCSFMNTVCGSDVDDLSSFDSQCECLLKAIVVCNSRRFPCFHLSAFSIIIF